MTPPTRTCQAGLPASKRRRGGLFVTALLLVVLYVLRGPLLLRTVGVKCLWSMKQLSRADALLLLGGDGSCRLAARSRLSGPDFAPRVLVLEGPPGRLQRLGILDPLSVQARNALRREDLPVFDNALTVIDYPGRGDWGRARTLRQWLTEHSDVRVAVLCDRMNSRRVRLIFRSVLGDDLGSRVHWCALADRKFDETNWRAPSFGRAGLYQRLPRPGTWHRLWRKPAEWRGMGPGPIRTDAAATALKPRRRRWLIRLLLVAVLFVLLLLHPVAIWRRRRAALDVSSPPRPVDDVLVLGGEVDTRPFVAAALYKAALAKRVLLTNVAHSYEVEDGLAPTEPEIARQVLLKLRRAAGGDCAIARSGGLDRRRGSAVAEAAISTNTLLPHGGGGDERLPYAAGRKRIFRAGDRRPGGRTLPFFAVPTEGFDAGDWWHSERGFGLVHQRISQIARRLLVFFESHKTYSGPIGLAMGLYGFCRHNMESHMSKPIYILGLNTFHADASAVLLKDGELVAAVAEERLNRVKHFAGFPAKAVREVLDIAGIALADVDHVGINKDSKANLLAKLGFALGNVTRITKLAKQRLEYRAKAQNAPQMLCEAMGVSADALKARVHNVEHHLCHVASCFLVSEFDQAAVLSIDGFGDFASTMTAGRRPRRQGAGSRLVSALARHPVHDDLPVHRLRQVRRRRQGDGSGAVWQSGVHGFLRPPDTMQVERPL